MIFAGQDFNLIHKCFYHLFGSVIAWPNNYGRSMWSSYVLDFKVRCFHSPKNEMILRTSKCKCVAFLDIVMNMPDTLSERLNCLRKTKFPITTLRSTVTGSWHLWTTNEAWPLVELMLHCAPEQLAKGRQFAGCWGYEKWIQDPGAGDWLVTTEMKKKSHC